MQNEKLTMVEDEKGSIRDSQAIEAKQPEYKHGLQLAGIILTINLTTLIAALDLVKQNSHTLQILVQPN